MSYSSIEISNNLIKNSKEGLYNYSSFNYNLDLFSSCYEFLVFPYKDQQSKINNIQRRFKNALDENKTLALANLLYILDIRNGLGRRDEFKILFSFLCLNDKESALYVLNLIPSLGRWDYIFVGLKTSIEDEVISMIKNQIEKDLKSDTPSLLAKWMPTHRTHKKVNLTAKYLMYKLNVNEKTYRKTLSFLRDKLNIVEKKLSNKKYDDIVFEHVPCKAILKYRHTFYDNCFEKYTDFLKGLMNNTKKVNINGFECKDITKQVMYYDYCCVSHISKEQNILFNSMWENQKQLYFKSENILVCADTSKSMYKEGRTISSSIGLAIYTAQHINGIVKNRYISFSNTAKYSKIKGLNIYNKIVNFKYGNSKSNIDSVFKLLLSKANKNNDKNFKMPEELIIISDMEFERGAYSKDCTNFCGWRTEFVRSGFIMPKIIFWNISSETNGYPVTKCDKDTLLISGFSTNILKYIVNLEKFDSIDIMNNVLKHYTNMINDLE